MARVWFKKIRNLTDECINLQNRGAVPTTATGGRSRTPLTGSRTPATGSRTPTRGRGASGGRVVPTGNRARRPPHGSSDDLPEVPRASAGNSGRPVNRIPLADQPDDDHDGSSAPTGFPGKV